jgi:regulatory protein
MSDHERCYIAAMRILNFRFNGEKELRRKLQAKRFEREVIDATIDRLRREKWLDDERFAASFVRARMQKRIGRARIRRELIASGVDDAAADRALRENVDPDREREDVAAECQKRIRLMKRRYGDDVLESPQARKKLAAYLLKRGYDAALVAEVVRGADFGEFEN